MTQPLSPTAQAVIDAFSADNYGVYLEGDPDRLAAAIRALVEAKLPEEPEYEVPYLPLSLEREGHLCWYARRQQRQRLRLEFLAVAAELGGMA